MQDKMYLCTYQIYHLLIYYIMKTTYKLLFIFLMSIFPFNNLLAQDIANQLEVTWQLLDNNYEGKGKALAKFRIKNQSSYTIPNYGWSLRFSNMRGLDVKSVKGDFKLEHVNGDLYELSPGSTFTDLEPGKEVEVNFVASRVPNFTDAPNGLYISSSLIQPNFQAITNYKILPFSIPEETNKSFLAALYEQNERIKDEKVNLSVVPTPLKMITQDGFFLFDNHVEITGESEFNDEIQLLKTTLKSKVQENSANTSNKSTKKVHFVKLNSLKSEAYKLDINEKGIVIQASSPIGAFYAIQSLLAVLPIHSFKTKQEYIKIPNLSIVDEPRFGYRGLLLDLSRNFRKKEEIFKVIDLMAAYKLNTLHLHFIDDEGWRIEIPSLPELTEVGSKRSAEYENGKSLQPSYGSGASSNDNQYLTKEDFISVLKHAKSNHIEVIPELETPGHSRAAVKSMEYRAKKRGTSPIHDLQDKSIYSSAQHWTDNVMDVGLEATFEFMETVIDEISMMYTEAGLSLKTMHMGGDELPKGAWAKSPAIQKLMQKKNIHNVHQVWPYYVNRILKITQDRGIKLAGWEELGMINLGKGMKPNPQFSDKDITLDVWNNIIGGGNEDLAYRLANLGYPVIFTSANNLYFDQAHSSSYNEPGHNWSTYIDLERTYSFMAHNFLRSIPPKNRLNKEALTAEGKKNIKGIKGALWSEKILDAERLEYMLIPRIFALAERAWAAEPEWEKPAQKQWEQLHEKDWSNFANRIGKVEIPRLESRWPDLNYRLPAIGIKEIDGKIACNLELPGFYIVYTTDGTEPQANGKRYTRMLTEKQNLRFKVFNSSGKGSYTTVYPHN